MKVLSLTGARPNFMKIAPVLRCMNEKNQELQNSEPGKNIESFLIHSGQHYDYFMSEVFFQDLNLKPDAFLGVGSGSHAEQTAKTMLAFEPICMQQKPDVVLVVGDVNTTLAGALVAAKLQIPIAHIEAGLRSFDRAMPEEINRLLTDQISDLLFTTEKSAEENLHNEGIQPEKIFFVGNVMIDSLRHLEERFNPDVLDLYGLEKGAYALITLHRPEIVNQPEHLETLISVLYELQRRIPVIFPVHPRTKQALAALKSHGGIQTQKNLQVIEPMGYLDFMGLMKFARFLITDSGGIQEETTVLDIPCITVRKTTERPVTVEQGTNVIAGIDPGTILDYCDQAIQGNWKKAVLPPLWDGKAAERIVRVLCERFFN